MEYIYWGRPKAVKSWNTNAIYASDNYMEIKKSIKSIDKATLMIHNTIKKYLSIIRGNKNEQTKHNSKDVSPRSGTPLEEACHSG